MIMINNGIVKIKGSKEKIVCEFGVLVRTLKNAFGDKEYEKIYNIILEAITEYSQEKTRGKKEILKQMLDLEIPEDVRKFILKHINSI